MKVKNGFKIIVAFLICATYSCNSTNDQKEKVEKNDSKESKLDSIKPKESKLEKKDVSKDDKKSEKKEISFNGTYKNSQNSVLIISNWSNTSFNFKYKLKGNCDGIEESGLAAFEDQRNALNYSEDGGELEHFLMNEDGSIELEFDFSMMDYIGMECIKFFDGHFVKQ
jgi:hypothetical protein